MKAQTQELTFQLRFVPNTAKAQGSVWLEGTSQPAPIRFDDLQSLVRYLRSFADDGKSRGLR